MIKHYTLLTFLLYGFLHASGSSFYEECEEYYDSRGFYHNSCSGGTIDDKKILNTLSDITALIKPGKGDLELGSSQANSDGVQSSGVKTDFSDEKEDENALKEHPTFEFGRE